MSTSDIPPNVLAAPEYVDIFHPLHEGMPILSFPKNNIVTQTPKTYGVHHHIALAACQIIAYNAPGFLSTSRNDRNARASLQTDQFLTSTDYYYHLADLAEGTDPNYPICVDFASWPFPHNSLPPSWPQTVPDSSASIMGSDWSYAIKARDERCRATEWIDNQTTAHIVPKEEIAWMVKNKMQIYSALRDVAFVDRDPRNLFVLRWDIHTLQFDHGNFVILPVDEQMVIHFIKPSHESAALLHNKPFDTSHLSLEFLFARFAWAVIKSAHARYEQLPAHARTFCLDDEDTTPMDEDGKAMEPDKGEGGSTQRRSSRIEKRKQPNDLTSADAAHEACEFAEDITTAKNFAPFFVVDDVVASAYAYQNMNWYPGWAAVEKTKKEYMDAHPNIRAHGEACASPDTNQVFGDDSD